MNLIVQISSKGHDFVKENRRTVVIIPKSTSKFMGQRSVPCKKEAIPDIDHVFLKGIVQA